MRIADILADRRAPDGTVREPIFSFEFFPPKTPKGEEALYQAIDELRSLGPAYVSVTYGAGGSTRERTLDWVTHIKNDHGVEAMAHLTCVGATRDELGNFIDELTSRGLENVLALRGDPPRGQESFRVIEGGFGHANELVSFIRKRRPALSIGVAGYPEKHPEAPDIKTDIDHLASKVEAGGDFVVTQLFFRNEAYYDFLLRLKSRKYTSTGRTVSAEWKTPVIPGLMPITSRGQIDKFITMCGATMPSELRARIERARSDEEVVEIGIDHATIQARDLLAHGAPGIHFYTLNKSNATRRILAALRGDS